MHRHIKTFATVSIGVGIGVLLPVLFHIMAFNASPPTFCRSRKSAVFAKERSLLDKKKIFVGVMTAERFLHTRAKAVYETWGQDLPGKLMFFSSSSSKNGDLPVVSLEGVDDSYPPQRKSMMMLKYMYDNFIDDYEWFLRSDDDVYVRGDKMEGFLQSLNSSDDLYIGQAGTGIKSEKGKLGLAENDNFCMGGPSVLMSASTLRKVAPHVEYCLKNMMSTHEDVEVGRCVKHFVGVRCTWSFEVCDITS